MSEFTFSDRVTLTHVVERHYVQAHTERRTSINHAASTVVGWARLEEVHDDGPLQFRPSRYSDEAGEEGIPGLPLPDPSLLPDRKGTYRMLRRHERAVSGVVVGWTWRVEGKLHDGGYDYYGEADPPYLSESRRVQVYQVAVDPGEVGGRPWPVEVVLALPEDVFA